ncbi:MAG TPA: c-type cytochrome [Acidobacteriaceae bacterium]|jgi:cytochrome c oxidase cbb3-type subunit 3/ubiquinol-cytochrome c reductase cytochrome c subunit
MKAGAFALAVSCALTSVGCGKLPGKPAPGPEVPRPESILSPHVLYAQNCVGCHGADGLHGPATPLASPVYQALVDDASLRRVVAQGVPNSMMPPFSKSFGGDLTDAQVDAIVRGMRADWNTGNALAGANMPPYTDDGKGNVKAGEQVYASNCARCHGSAGGKIGKSGSVLNSDFLSLMTSQGLRTAVIVGRPDLGMPDWRNQRKGVPMTAQDVSDVVAFLVAQKPTLTPERTQGPQAMQGPAHQPKMSGGVR